MKTINVSFSELQEMSHQWNLPPDTKLKISFEDDEAAQKIIKTQNALEAIRKLKGTGNGNLINTLLKEREKDITHG